MQAKQKQRHGNKEQIDSDQRGGGRWNNGGKKGKSQGTCIKDPWTKTNWGGLNLEDGEGQGR